ncbi:DUF6503 family protein [Gramella sp. AN32]|uniref:DUF6503 family protein n=1 Tax=Christiangramia antarctica TaxID=2058158 RepID=A0ABW5XAI3_9FLAO|nr:DUF6503 family protein [Gramella sp. AN32]MCM4154548.1 deoxyribose-phosphate aldolase [Gramella sp. AN32]
MKKLFPLFLLLAFIACSKKSKDPSAQEIVNKAIENTGGDLYSNAEISFTFRNRNYRSIRRGGKFLYERTMIDSIGDTIVDKLSNVGLERMVNDSVVEVADSLVMPISNSVNSVHYFVLIPFGLDAPAANKKLLGKDSIFDKEYYEIEVTFSEKGGGTDHEDEYVYWIDTQDYSIDYLAYNFEVNDGGIRFRKAVNPRIIEGIKFVDYENYKYRKLETPLKALDSLFETNDLDKVSDIITEDIKVKIGR